MQLLRCAHSVSRFYTEPSKQSLCSNQTTVIIAPRFPRSILLLATSFTFRNTNAVKPQRVEYQNLLIKCQSRWPPNLRICEFRTSRFLRAICLHRGIPRVPSARPLIRCRLTAWLRRTAVISEIIQNGRQFGLCLVRYRSHVSGPFVYIRRLGGTVRILPNQAWAQGLIAPCNKWCSQKSKISVFGFYPKIITFSTDKC